MGETRKTKYTRTAPAVYRRAAARVHADIVTRPSQLPAARRRRVASTMIKIAGTTKTRWCDHEMGLITVAVRPTRVKAASSSPSAWALTARERPSAQHTAANDSHSRPGAPAEPYSRSGPPDQHLFGAQA